jgi:hypothetical protein
MTSAACTRRGLCLDIVWHHTFLIRFLFLKKKACSFGWWPMAGAGLF